MPDRSSPDWWDERYTSGDIPWDTGIVPPEVVALVESRVASLGWALDLGCGSGVTSRYLASCGFRVAGIDLSRAALRRAHVQASAAGLRCVFIQGGVADLGFLRVKASLAVDVGCFHSLAPAARAGYIRSLANHLLPGAHYLLYTFLLPQAANGPTDSTVTPTISPTDVAAFAPQFALLKAAHGEDRDRPSAWFWMRRA